MNDYNESTTQSNEKYNTTSQQENLSHEIQNSQTRNEDEDEPLSDSFIIPPPPPVSNIIKEQQPISMVSHLENDLISSETLCSDTETQLHIGKEFPCQQVAENYCYAYAQSKGFSLVRQRRSGPKGKYNWQSLSLWCEYSGRPDLSHGNSKKTGCPFKVHLYEISKRQAQPFVRVAAFDPNHKGHIIRVGDVIKEANELTSDQELYVKSLVMHLVPTTEILALLSTRFNLTRIDQNVWRFLLEKIKMDFREDDEKARDLYNAMEEERKCGGRLEIRLNGCGKLLNLFFMSQSQVILAKQYSDSLTIDTSHKVNRFGNPLTIITGVDCFYRPIILAICLHYYDDYESFLWLIQNFLDAIGGNSAEKICSIFRDEDPALQQAVAKALPSTNDFLCRWHRAKNNAKALSAVLGEDFKEFEIDFNRTFYETFDVALFEKAYSELCAKYPKAQPVLKSLFSKRHRLSEAYIGSIFRAGMVPLKRYGTGRYQAEIWKFTTLSELFNIIKKTNESCIQEREQFMEQLLQFSDQKTDSFKISNDVKKRLGKKVFALLEKQFDIARKKKYTCYTENDGITKVQYIPGHVSHFINRSRSGRASGCSCATFGAKLLPCRHMIFYNLVSQLPSVSMEDIPSRWLPEKDLLITAPSTNFNLSSNNINNGGETALFNPSTPQLSAQMANSDITHQARFLKLESVFEKLARECCKSQDRYEFLMSTLDAFEPEMLSHDMNDNLPMSKKRILESIERVQSHRQKMFHCSVCGQSDHRRGSNKCNYSIVKTDPSPPPPPPPMI